MSDCTCYLVKGKYCNECNPKLSVEYVCGQLNDLRIQHAELAAWSTVREIKCNDLVNAAQAVIERWDSPKWKDQTHTGEYIHALRLAVQAVGGE